MDIVSHCSRARPKGGFADSASALEVGRGWKSCHYVWKSEACAQPLQNKCTCSPTAGSSFLPEVVQQVMEGLQVEELGAMLTEWSEACT